MNTTIKYSIAVLIAIVLSACGGSGGGSSGSSPSAAGWERQAGNPLIVPRLTTTTLDYGPADPTVLFDTEDNKWMAVGAIHSLQTDSGVKRLKPNIRTAYATNVDRATGVIKHWMP